MKYNVILIALASLFVVCLSSPAWSDSYSLTGGVAHVYDGDTIRVDPVGKVRLLGIDCPEREASDRDRFYLRQGVEESALRRAAVRARAFVTQLTSGQTVTLKLDEEQRDRHGRLLAYVYLPDGRMLNRLLLEQGLASAYRRFSFEYKSDFIEREKIARDHSLGFWAGKKEDDK